MNKRQVENYVEAEMQKGLKRQDIFNDIMATSDFKIQEVAEIIRKIPELETRKQYKTPNTVLQFFLALVLVSHLCLMTGIIEVPYISSGSLSIFLLIIPSLLLYGVNKFKRNAHLVSGLFLLLASISLLLMSITHGDVFAVIDTLFNFAAALLAFYLNAKLSGDYIYHRDLVKENPELRENTVTFVNS